MIRRQTKLAAIWIVASLLLPGYAHAQSNGMTRYSNGYLQVYGNGDWNILDQGSSGASCGTAGGFRFNVTAGQAEYCNGIEWRSMNSGHTVAGGGSAGMTKYSNGQFMVHNGTAWVVAGGAPLHRWKFEETSGTLVADSQPNPLNGTFSGAANVTSAPVAIDGAGLVFDGSNDWVDVNNTGNVFLTVPFTWTMWVKANTLPSASIYNRYVIFMRHSSAPWTPYVIWADDANDKFRFTGNNSGGSAWWADSDVKVVVGRWFHLAAVVDASYNTRFYVDGVQQAMTGSPGSLLAANLTMRFGANIANEVWDGVIDDIRFYDRALTSGEISGLYWQGNPSVEKTIVLTSGSSWTVPSDWNDNLNSIEVIGGGAKGIAGSATCSGRLGGGGGAYSVSRNVDLTPGATVSYAVGAGGATGSVNGGDTYICNSTSNCASIGGTAVVAGAKGGAQTGGVGGASSGGVATGPGALKYSGGNGGSGTNCGGTGGGGAGGPYGGGANGGTASGAGGSGGGGAGGGTNANNTSTNNGSNGGYNYLAAGRGIGGTSGNGTNGTSGGGGGGGFNGPGLGGAGGSGVEISGSEGSGGGGGGGSQNSAGGAGGLYGGGGGGGGSGAGVNDGGNGGQGVIVIKYTPSLGGPNHHYKLDETTGTTINDTGSDTAINGTFSGAANVTSDANAPVTTGLVFDGTDDLIDITNTGNAFQSVPFTWSMWFRIDTLASVRADSHYLIRMRHSASPWASYVLMVSSATDKVRWSVNNSGGTGFHSDTNDTIAINRWYHVAVTLDSTYRAKIYLDGILQNDSELPGSLYNADGQLRLNCNNATQSCLDGNMDDVRFYSRTLSANEIKAIYDQTKPIQFIQQTNLMSSGTAATHPATFPALPTPGNTVVVHFATWLNGAHDVRETSVTDNHGNSYQKACKRTMHTTDSYLTGVWYASNIKLGAASSFTVTVAPTVGTEGLLRATEYMGLSSISPLDKSADNYTETTTTTPTTTTTATTSTARQLLAASLDLFASNVTSITTPTNWTGRGSTINGTNPIAAFADRVVYSTGAYAAVWTVNPAENYLACIATFAQTPISNTCPGGFVSGGYCYYDGPSGSSCDTTCAGYGRACNLAGTQAASVDNATCTSILTGLGRAPQAVTAGAYLYGCSILQSSNAVRRHTTSTSVTCGATAGGYNRVCACD